ncbi:MAG: glycosyl hydrolase [Ruminococcaceae bacterium]|nr:glycosyl hydrolase [Oscillospiraceae bacterium]
MNIEKRIDEIISKMTLHEKVLMCHANSKMNSEGVPSQGIEELTMNDGPHGMREEMERNSWKTKGLKNDFCTYLPTGTALAATWNASLARLHGEVLGEEARHRKKDVVLGPGFNIIRTPLCGRNFEYMSEDPLLCSVMAPEVVRGIQSADTAACVKHYALNNQELDRMKVDVDLSDRALREIYLPAFKAAADAGAYSFMGSYSKYKGQHCCHNKVLLCDILKDEWGWDGVVISDWAGVHDTEEAARYGMDIEMGTPTEKYSDYFLGDAFEKLCEENEEYVAFLDDKVRRILRLMFRINKFSPDRKSGSFNTPEHQKATYDIAKEAIVLLKNDGVLPLPTSTKKLLVVGDNADMYHSHGGNSSAIKALYEITPLQGLINAYGEENVEYVKSTQFQYEPIPTEYLDISELKSGSRAFRMECYDNGLFEGEPTVYFVDKVEQIYDGVSRVFTATLNIPETGEYAFYMNADRGSRFFFNGELVKYFSSENNGIPYEFTRRFEAGERIDIRVQAMTIGTTPLELLWAKNAKKMPIEFLLQKARKADAVVFCGGINHSFDTENFDKPDLKLPGEQNELIPLLAKANPNTVVTVTAGSAVDMPWADDVRAILWSWYSGMEGGNALADIISGKVSPSGKMPFTLPYKLEDCPAHRYGEYKATSVRYNEDIYVGYRGFEKDGIAPRFAFGHGLSYADFEYSDISVVDSKDSIDVSFSVTNTSDVDAKETSQVYFGINGAIDRPVKELKGFCKLSLCAGETKKATVKVDKKALRVWNDGWTLLHGTYTVSVASASDDVRLTKEITI